MVRIRCKNVYVCPAGEIQKTCLFFLAKTTVILRYIHFRTMEEVLHVLPGQPSP